jgi:hypothetical protein
MEMNYGHMYGYGHGQRHIHGHGYRRGHGHCLCVNLPCLFQRTLATDNFQRLFIVRKNQRITLKVTFLATDNLTLNTLYVFAITVEGGPRK